MGLSAVGEREVLRAAVGEVEVPLEESPTTGYRWSLTEHPPEVVPVDAAFVPAGPPTPGGRGTRVFRFRVQAAGTFTLRFERRRAWEAAAIEAREVQLVTEP